MSLNISTVLQFYIWYYCMFYTCITVHTSACCWNFDISVSTQSIWFILCDLLHISCALHVFNWFHYRYSWNVFYDFHCNILVQYGGCLTEYWWVLIKQLWWPWQSGGKQAEQVPPGCLEGCLTPKLPNGVILLASDC